MLDSADLIAFVSTTDVARARRFYDDTLGLPLVDQTPFALVFQAHGTTLRVTVVERTVPAPYTVLGWGVADIAAMILELRSRGGTFIRYEEMDQDELGVWRAPSGAKIAWFNDPDANILSLTQF